MRTNRGCLLLILGLAAGLLPAGCAARVDLDAAARFQEAQKVFDSARQPEDFLRAAALYQQILDSGVVSGAVLYNQGNAFMRAGQRGRAIAAYRQAQRYRPRDPYLEANLAYALGENQPATRRPIVEHILFWQNWLSYPEKFYLAAAAALLAFALGTTSLFVRRRLLGRSALVAVALTTLFALSAAYDWYRYDYLVHGVVASKEVIARKGNGTAYQPAFTEPLREGTEFLLLERRGDWLLVRLTGGQEAWLPAASVVLY